MIHSLVLIARHRYLNPSNFQAFVKNRFPQINDEWLTTYDVDDIVDSYIRHIGEERYRAEREQLIKNELAYLRSVS